MVLKSLTVFVSLLLLPLVKGDLSKKIFQNFCPFFVI